MSHAQARLVDELRDRIVHLEGHNRRVERVLPFGIEKMDGRLSGGGLAFGSLHEFAGGGSGTSGQPGKRMRPLFKL